MKEQSDRTRVRQAVAQHKVSLTIYAVLAVFAFIAWLVTLYR